MQPGHSPLLVIFAAFVVWFDGRRVRSKLVDGSVYIWPSKGQAHTKGPGTGRRAQHNAAMWNEVPDFIRDANIVPPDHNDYHGNFTAGMFNKMFTGVCKNLQAMGLEKCRIHLDGASYHFHKANSKPASYRRADLAEWIQRENVREWLAKDSTTRWLEQKNLQPSPTSTAIVLKVVAKRYSDRSKWTIYGIAKKNGNHIICKTPPYHCELQPIEKIWAVVKNMVAASSTGRHTALSLKRTLVEHFFSIPEKLFLSVWRKSILIGIEYQKNKPKVDGEDGQEQEGGDIMDNDNEEEEKEKVVGEAEVVAAAVADDDEEETPVFDPESTFAGLSEQMWLLSLDLMENRNDNRLAILTYDREDETEEGGVDESIVEAEEEEGEALIDNRRRRTYRSQLPQNDLIPSGLPLFQLDIPLRQQQQVKASLLHILN